MPRGLTGRAGNGLMFSVDAWKMSQKGHLMKLKEVGEDEFRQESRVCEVCGDSLVDLLKVQNLTGQTGLRKTICGRCTNIKFNRLPKESWYGEMFKDKFNAGEIERIGIPPVDNSVYEAISGYLPEIEVKKVCDVGCGFGEKSKVFEARGWSVVGTEPLEKRARAANSLLAGKVFNLTVEDVLKNDDFIKQAPFGLCTFSCVLEFCRYPIQLLRGLHDLMSAGGLVCITTGLFEERNVLQEAYYSIIRHTFNPYSLELLLKRAGFEVLECRRRKKNIQVIARKAKPLAPGEIREKLNDARRRRQLSIVAGHLKRELSLKNTGRAYWLKTSWRANQRKAVLTCLSGLGAGEVFSGEQMFNHLPITFVDNSGDLRVFVK